MALKQLVENAVTQIGESVSTPLTESEITAISKIVEQTLVKSVNQSTKRCTQAAVVCCGPEADLAHKIAEEVERTQQLLIANLMAMR